MLKVIRRRILTLCSGFKFLIWSFCWISLMNQGEKKVRKKIRNLGRKNSQIILNNCSAESALSMSQHRSICQSSSAIRLERIRNIV